MISDVQHEFPNAKDSDWANNGEFGELERWVLERNRCSWLVADFQTALMTSLAMIRRWISEVPS